MTRSELDAALRALLRSPTALALGRRTGRRREDPWHTGACLVLATAVHHWLGDRSELVQLGGSNAHIFVRVNDVAIDADGARPVSELLALWERSSDFDPARHDMTVLSQAAAERSGVEFDDYASERLLVLLRAKLPPASEAMTSLEAT